MIVHLPLAEIEAALKEAESFAHLEVGGFFCTRPSVHNMGEGGRGYDVIYRSMVNHAPAPASQMHVKAEEIATMIVDEGLYPVAFFHSHPSGSHFPSEYDEAFFPSDYVDHGLLWAGSEDLVHYNAGGLIKLIRKDQVFLDVGQ